MDNKYAELFRKLHPTIPLNKNSRILIIDGTNTYIRVFSNVPSMNDNGEHVGGVIGFLKSIGALIRKEMPTHCIIVFDGVGGSQFRRKLYPDYKANRKNTSRFNRFDEFRDLEDERASMKKQFNRIIQYLDVLPIVLLSIDNIEADDTIAYIVEYYKQFESEIVISSSDRDFLQLVDDKISVWSPIKKIMYVPKTIEKEFGFLPKNYLIYRTITGDTGDNIPGIEGIGLKTLLKRFPELIDDEITVEQFIENNILKEQENPKVKIFKTIKEGTEKIHLNHKLMQLRNTHISGHSKLTIISKIQQKLSLNRKEFLKMFFEDGLQTMIKDPHEWMNKTFNRLEIYGK